jgi:hypothetical protein
LTIGGNPRRRRLAQYGDGPAREVLLLQHAGAHRVVDVVVHIGDEVGDAHHLPLERGGTLGRVEADGDPFLPFGMAADAVAHFPAQIESAPVALQHVHDAKALLVVAETRPARACRAPAPPRAERRVAQVVPEGDGLGELFVQPQHLGDGAGDLRDLERVREARAVVVAGRREEHLRLVLQAAERLAVDDAIAVALERGADVVFHLGAQAPPRLGALGRLGRQRVELELLQRFPNTRH